jgi:L-amino acid N-acyltransferase YncA
LSLLVRQATAADLSTVAEIFGWYAAHSVATFEEAPRPVAQWRELHDRLAALGLPFLVADADGEVAGYAYAAPWRQQPAYRHTVEDSIFIAPGMAGRGAGRELLGRLLPGAVAAGARQVIAVIADTGDPASVRLHERFGFQPAGRLTGVGYKHGRWIDTLLMQYSAEPDASPRPEHEQT